LLAYVLNKHGKPLMPCGPRKARLLLKEGKAKVVYRVPFTIQLLYGSSGYRQPIYCGRDPGLTQGVGAIRGDGRILFLAEVTGRKDISELIYQRRCLRRSRRHRKTRYRKPRFDNRRRSEGWLPPSVAHLLYEHQKVRRLVESILPVTAWADEINRFDTHRMWNPGVSSRGYQEGPLKGKFDVREYVLERDSYWCVLCGSPEKREVHHIIWRFRGGSNRPRNLVTLCGDFHSKVTSGEIPLSAIVESYRWPARLNAINKRFLEGGSVSVPAYRVKRAREELGLDKTHASDALAVICSAFHLKPDFLEMPPVYRGRFVRRENRQLHRANPAKGGKRPRANANRYLMNKHGVRLTKYDLVEYRNGDRRLIGYINTLRSSGTARVSNWQGRELANVSVNQLKKLQNADTLIWEVD